MPTPTTETVLLQVSKTLEINTSSPAALIKSVTTNITQSALRRQKLLHIIKYWSLPAHMLCWSLSQLSLGKGDASVDTCTPTVPNSLHQFLESRKKLEEPGRTLTGARDDSDDDGDGTNTSAQRHSGPPASSVCSGETRRRAKSATLSAANSG